MAGLGGWLVVDLHVLAGRGRSRVRSCRSPSASAWSGAPSRYRALAADAARLVHDEAFTSRFLPVGEPDVDALIVLYNRMVDRLRDERVRLAEQHQFLAQVIAASPSGIVVLGFDDEVASLNPAAARLLGRPAAEVTGRRIGTLATPLAGALAALGPGESRVVGFDGASRVRSPPRRASSTAASRARFFLIEELTDELRQAERAAYEKLIRVMSHEVNNTVDLVDLAAAVVAHLRARAGAREPARFRGGARRRHRADHAAEHLHARLRRRLPPAGAGAAAVRAGRRSSSASCALLSARPDAGGVDWRWELRRAGDPRRRRSGAARAGDRQHREERRRGGRRRRHRHRRGRRRRRAADPGHRGQRPGPHRRGPGQPVHAVLQHQAGRPGHRPHAGRARSSPATASTTRSSGRTAAPPRSASPSGHPERDVGAALRAAGAPAAGVHSA